MKQLIIAAACLAAFSAHATVCADGILISQHPGGNCDVPAGNPAGNTVSGQQQQAQGQLQGQGQHQQATGGNAGAASSSNASAGASNITNVSTGNAAGSGDSYRSLAVALPSPAPAIAPTMIGGPVSMVVLPCGPMVRTVAKQVQGTQYGVFSNDVQDLGTDVDFAPYLDYRGERVNFEQRGDRWFGHQILIMAGMSSVSGAVSLSIGGFGERGGGSAGGGVSGGMTRIVSKALVRECDMGPVVVPVAFVPPAVVVAPAPVVAKRPVRKNFRRQVCIPIHKYFCPVPQRN